MLQVEDLQTPISFSCFQLLCKVHELHCIFLFTSLSNPSIMSGIHDFLVKDHGPSYPRMCLSLEEPCVPFWCTRICRSSQLELVQPALIVFVCRVFHEDILQAVFLISQCAHWVLWTACSLHANLGFTSCWPSSAHVSHLKARLSHQRALCLDLTLCHSKMRGLELNPSAI